ncbi:MAG: acetolactate decarboxylase [Nitrospiraceae bacterium]|nr:acetolactate decarboxylase [Nitrospiraceae bacterium]
MKNEHGSFKKVAIMLLGLAGLLCAALAIAAVKEGLVEYEGAQKTIFKTGKATSVISLETLSTRPSLYAIGPIDGLDGEITIFDSKPYITQMRGTDYTLDTTFKHGAFFLVWTEQKDWADIPLPANVKGYIDLQKFVKEAAQKSGVDVTKPFPFLLSGTPSEIKWHINVDRTGGKPINQELFVKSKEPYVTKNEPVDIIGFYSEKHSGVFLSQYAPAIKEGSGMENYIHLHLVSRTSKAAGHIDDITFGGGMMLRLPKL